MNQFNVEQRSGKDRRKNRAIKIRSLLIGGRREKIRRKEDMQILFFADRYSPFLFAVVVTILLLSVTDALLTLFLIGEGASELNPIMAYYIRIGPYSFLAVKYALTSIGVVSFLLLRNIYLRPFKMHTGTIFYFIVGLFMTVVAWELYLISSFIFESTGQ